MKIRLAIRGYAGKALVFQDRVDVAVEELDRLLPKLAEEHMDKLRLYPKFTIEIEFLDEPNPNTRFFRMSNSPDCLREPLKVDLTDPDARAAALKRWKGNQ